MNRTFWYLLLASLASVHLTLLRWQLRLPRSENLTPARAWIETEYWREQFPYRKERLGDALSLWLGVGAAIGVYEASRLATRCKQLAEQVMSPARDMPAAGSPPPAAVSAHPRDEMSEGLRERAAGIRRRTSLALALADAVPGGEARARPSSSAAASLRFSACELLCQTLERQAHGEGDGENAHLTAHDFEQLRHLAVRVERLRHEAGQRDATAGVVRALADRATGCAECAEEMREALDAFTAAEDAFRGAVRDAAGQLRGEIALLDRHAAGSGERPRLARRLDDYLAAAPAGTDARGRASGKSSADRARVSPGPLDLDGLRIDACLRRVASAFAAFEHKAAEAAAACVRRAEGAIARICADGLVRPRGASGPDAAPAPPGSPREMPSAVLLEYGRQPELASFDCSPDLTVLLAVADEAARAADGRADVPTIAEACGSLRESLRHADADVTRALSMPTHAAESLAAARDIFRDLEAGLDPRLVRAAALTLEHGRATAADVIKAAEQMARIGEVDLADRLARRAEEASLGGADKQATDAYIGAVRSWLAVAKEKFDVVRREAAGLALRRQGFPTAGAGPSPGDPLRTALVDFFRHRSSLRLGPGSGASRLLDEWTRECEPWCRLVGLEPPPCGWATMTAALGAARPQAVEPARGFVDALCAMSSAQGDIAAREAATIGDAVTRSGIAADAQRVSAVVADWRRATTEKSRVAAIAQAVVNVDAIQERRLLESLLRELRAVARADGDLGEAEITVYHAFLIRIVHRLHGGGD